MRTLVTAAWLWDSDILTPRPVIEIEDGVIASIRSLADGELPSTYNRLDYPDAILAPSFFDVHMHGGAGHDLMEATPEAMSAISSFLATRGTGSFLATTVTAPLDDTLKSLSGLATLLGKQQPGAKPLGIHLEGPFLSHEKRGVHPPEHLLKPEIPVFDRMFEAAEGKIRLMTLAPEIPGAIELAAHATSKGVRVSMGHSNATSAEAHALHAAGATSATHTFNAMRALDHREPGILGTVLSTDSLYAELICDGIHVHPMLVKVWWRAKGRDRGILITDAMTATGMPDGEYRLGGMTVQVANGRASLGDVLAGSVLTLDRGLKNFVAFTGATVEEVLPLVTRNPAAMTGFADGVGRLRVGDTANLVALKTDGSLIASINHGKLAIAAG
ncbi:N-acetylglucosamine-6-phosphate deacetylase [Acidicapsa ligni]|uniref:N-acetylglucosamine-6-phosphate deacetylase n=1 Tax=Acidicapsa ligni TaxID=542300 RepID=UPI0021DFB99F|nr:N-acetylglucosamine-6-phosphate deacetylase [Acidicapsa ligni]